MNFSKICLLYDSDGFRYKKNFYIRELGLMPIVNGKPLRSEVVRFDLGVVFSDSTTKFCETLIHGLPVFSPQIEPALHVHEADDIVSNYYQKFSTEESPVVAYKGGQEKRNFLRRLGLPCVDLEEMGCPRLDHFMQAEEERQDCGWHSELKFGTHCCGIKLERMYLFFKDGLKEEKEECQPRMEYWDE